MESLLAPVEPKPRKANKRREHPLGQIEIKLRKQPKSMKNTLKKLPKNNEELREALFESFIMARRGKTNTDDEFKFEAFWFENLEQLAEDIVAERYKPSRSKAFITHDPVIREIFAAPFRDRIIHHLLYAIVAPWWDERFINNSFSCRNGKGTDYGVFQLQTAMRKASRNGTRRAIVIKGDLSGYFMSLKRSMLFEKIEWGLNRQFPKRGWLYQLCWFLWREVIFDDPVKGVRRVGRRKDWEKLPKNKSLFCQPPGYGIVIGNLTSQLLSNIMLNEFDWWMRQEVGFKYYGRYVDDFYVVVPEEDYGYAMAIMQEVAPAYLNDMHLKLHPNKRYVQEVKHGCPFLGKIVHLDCLLPGKRVRRNVKKAFREFVAKGTGEEGIISYVGMMKYVDGKKFMASVIEGCGGRYTY